MGWGLAIGKIFDWLPGKQERNRGKINSIKREMDELKKKPATPRNVVRMERLAKQLRVYQERSQNI